MSSSRILWEPLFPITFVLAFSLLALITLILWEIKRKQKFRYLRIFAQVLIVSTVAGILMQPKILSKKETPPVLLLTKNYSKHIADSLANISREMKIFKTTDAVGYPRAVEIAAFNEIEQMGSGIQFILGEGVPAYALDLIEDKNYRYFRSLLPEGILHLDQSERFYVNRWNKIHGEYCIQSKTIWLLLAGPGGIEDSVKITGSGVVPFSISFYPKMHGLIDYQIIERDTTTKQEKVSPLPLEVHPEMKLNIFLLNSYPSFEQRYLKNFLSEKGHGLAVRNQVSRERFLTEFINRSQLNLRFLTSNVLNEFDLLIIDSPTLQSLSQNEKQTLQTAIEDGLGVLILPTKADAGKEKLLPLRPVKVQADTAYFSLEKLSHQKLLSMPLTPVGTHEPLLLSRDGRSFTGYTFYGSGKIGFQILQETYQLGLQGKAEEYSAVWTPLLEAVAREENLSHKLKIKTPFPWRENEPIDLEILSAREKPVLTVDSIRIPLAGDVRIDDLWHARIWLDGNKWHQLQIGSEKYYLSLVASDDWLQLSVANQMKANLTNQAAYPAMKKNGINSESRAIQLILFVVFLIASGFLWLAPKL